jgi:PAS domain S-box-containing protein
VASQPANADPATLLRSLTRNIPGVIYRCALDSDWTMHLIGDEIERITGYPADDFIQNRTRTYASVIHPDDRDLVERDVMAAVEADRTFELEYRVVTASGEERWVLERGCCAPGEARNWLDGIIFDITDRRRYEETARRAEADAAVARELAESRRRIVQAADKARRRIERDLHDGAQQSFVCARLTLRTAQGMIDDDPQTAATMLELTAEHLDRGLHEVRELASGIHPAQLAAGGLGPAVTALQKNVPLPVDVVDELHDRLPSEVETALYFSCAEAIANAVKHSEATAIRVRLGHNDGRAFIEVVDDGKGGASLEQGSGLRGLTDRVAVLSGTVAVESPPGNGTRLLVEIPASG